MSSWRGVGASVAVALMTLTACSSSASPADDQALPEPSPTGRAFSEAPGPEQGPRPTPSPEGTAGPPTFASSVERISPAVRERMTASHRPGCPVALTGLRYLQLSYVGFDGRAREGELVVAARHADDVVTVFERLFEARWPIRRMVLVDEYDGDDDLSMAANNTSGYNCRRVAGTDRWSNHAYGGAIDINPVQNPYVQGSSFVPENAAEFAFVPRGPRARVDRGVIHAGDVVVDAFTDVGWEWGGTWTGSKDYQHFSAGGG